MKKHSSIAIILIMVCTMATVILAQEKDVNFNAAEAESMLFLFNETTIKGSDLELLIPLNKKLKEGLQKARKVEDKEESVPLKLTPEEANICLNIINNATFEARYAQLVLGMKKKLKKILPPKVINVPSTNQQNN